jgi:hypothetical protein
VLRIRHDGKSQGISPRPTVMAELRVGASPWPSLATVQSGWTCDQEATTKARMLLPPSRARGYHSRIRQVRRRPEGEGRSQSLTAFTEALEESLVQFGSPRTVPGRDKNVRTRSSHRSPSVICSELSV